MKDLQPAAVHRATRAVALLLALTFLVPLFSTPVWAAPTAESILRQMNQINPGLSDLKAQIKIDLKL